VRRFSHGTAEAYAVGFLRGAPLSQEVATTLKIDGPPGFYLAEEESDAEFFALRRSRGAIIFVEIEEEALSVLESAGARLQPIPGTLRSPKFAGSELWIPVSAFDTFNQLRDEGAISVHA
jgi:hypothetical protein